jgi:hypothetical protein
MTPFFRAFLTGTVDPEPPGKGSFSYPNPGPYRAPIGLRRGSSGEFRAKRGYFRARFSGATFYRGFEAIRALSAGISVLYYCLLIGESGYGMDGSREHGEKQGFSGPGIPVGECPAGRNCTADTQRYRLRKETP